MKKNKTVEYGKYGLLFLIPFFLVFLVFQLYPLLYTFYNSLIYSAKNGRYVTETVGLGNFTNYVFAKTGSEFWQSLMVTVVLWILNFIPQILLALLLAAWFTDIKIKLKGSGIYKVIMYMPNIITAATIAVLFYGLFEVNGPITTLFKDLGWCDKGGILNHGWASLIIIAFIQFWMWYGNTMIVLIAGILGINPSLYEAAMVDGASSRQTFFSITLPLLKPILQYTLVTSAIGGLQMYDIPALFNVSGTGDALPNYASQTITMYIRKLGFTTKDMGKSAAASMILFVVTLVISLLFFALTREREPKQKHAVIK